MSAGFGLTHWTLLTNTTNDVDHLQSVHFAPVSVHVPPGLVGTGRGRGSEGHCVNALSLVFCGVPVSAQLGQRPTVPASLAGVNYQNTAGWSSAVGLAAWLVLGKTYSFPLTYSFLLTNLFQTPTQNSVQTSLYSRFALSPPVLSKGVRENQAACN